jgi:hypothetical protein
MRAVYLLSPLMADVSDTLTIGFFSFNGSPIGAWQTPNAPTRANFQCPFVVPPDAYYINVLTARGVGNGSGIRIPFQLSL